MMARLMTVMWTVPVSDLTMVSQLRLRYAAARKKEPRHPSAAASVGVAMPITMTPVTRKTIKPSGSK